MPAALAGAASIDEFMARLPEYDGEMQARAEAAAAQARPLSLPQLKRIQRCVICAR